MNLKHIIYETTFRTLPVETNTGYINLSAMFSLYKVIYVVKNEWNKTLDIISQLIRFIYNEDDTLTTARNK